MVVCDTEHLFVFIIYQNSIGAVVFVVQLLSCVYLVVTPWTATHQAFLTFTSTLSLLRFMSIELVMPSNHLILCRPLLHLPSVGFRAHLKSRIISFQDPKPITSANNLFQRRPHSEIPDGHESFGGACFNPLYSSFLVSWSSAFLTQLFYFQASSPTSSPDPTFPTHPLPNCVP